MAGLKINIDASGATQGAAQFARATDSMAQAAARAVQQSDAVTESLSRQERALQTVARATQAFQTVLGALGLAVTVRELVLMADTYRNLEGRLRLVTSSSAELKQVQDALFQSAQQTRSSFEGTVELYGSLARNANALGASQSALLAVTKTINQAMQISGASAGTARAGLLQLGQAFASGVLRGDEFNSVMENTPRLAQAIAAGMKVTVGELRNLAEQGKLTATAVFAALRGQGEAIDREFSQLPQTIGQALTTLSNSFLRLVGDADQAAGASSRLAIAISGIAGAIDSLHRSTAQQQDIQNLTNQFDFAAKHAEEAANRIRQAATLGIDVGKSQVVREELQRLTSTLAGLQETVDRINKAGGKAALTGLLDPLTAKALGEAYAKAGEKIPAALAAIGGGVQKFTAEQLAAQKETDALIKRMKEHAATVNLSGEALAKYLSAQALANTGDKERADLVYKTVLADEAAKAAKEADTKATQANAAAQHKAAQQRAQDLQDLKDAELLINKLAAQKVKVDEQEAKVNAESLRALQDKGATLQEEAQILAASLGPQQRLIDLELQINLARIERTRQTDLAAAAEKHLSEENINQINVNADLARSIAEATAAEKKRQEALKNSILTTGDVSNAFKQLATGFFQGTQSLKQLVPDFFKGLAITAFGKFIEQKFFSLDKPLIENVSGLMGQGGLLSSIFSAGGSFFGDLFGSSFNSQIFGTNGGILSSAQLATGFDASSIVWSTAGTEAGGAFGLSFGQAGAIAALAAFGSQIGVGFANLVGVGKTGPGKTGAKVAGALFGGLFGPVGGVIGDLFEHVPTRGTRVRKGIVDFLKDIKASFAEEINTKHYFFKETKDLAAAMFDDDFLAASKQILNDKVGPDIANQLKALGAFITADQAKKLGKSTEQAGTTFGLLLVKNLGVKAIPEAISEIVDKSGLTLDILVKKLNDLFSAKDISVDFFKDAILGAVDIFTGDLPEAIGVSKIALKSFAEDGTFDLEKFKKSVEGATDIFNLVSQQFVDAIKNSKSGEEAARIFGEGVKKGIKDLALDAFLKDFIDKRLFAGIDLSDGLDSGEIDVLKNRIHDARIEAAAFITALDDTGDAVDGVTEKVRELNATLADLENKRIQIQVDFASQLGSIGALTPQQVIDVRKQSIAPIVNKALNPAGPIGTHPFSGFTDTELQDANDALKEAGDLAVASFHAFEQEQKDLLQTQIETINSETQAAINGIHAEFDAKREAGQRAIDGLQKQKELQSRIFQDRIDALQTELQTAQEFRRVSESIQQTINSLTLSNSPLFGSEKLAFLQRQATGLRGDSSAKAIEELSQNLASQLQVGQEFLDPTTFAKLFGDVTDELQRLRDKTAQQGNRAEDIQRNIEKLQEQSTAALDRIDAQIAAQQTYIQSLATSENNAIAAAQRAGAERISAAQAVTTKAINEYRDATVAQLKEFAAARDEIVAEQKFREIQRAKLDDEQLTHIKNIDANTFATADLIRAFLASNATQSVTPAATGFSGIVDRPRLFLAGESGRESVSIQPVGKGSGSVTFAPTISVTMQSSGNPEQDGARLGKALSDAMMREYQTGALGRAIRDDARRRG